MGQNESIENVSDPDKEACEFENWGYTNLRNKKYKYTWIIDNFSVYGESLNQSSPKLKSNKFPNDKNKTKWHLELNYNYVSQHRTYVGLQLFLDASHNEHQSTSQTNEVNARFELSIVNKVDKTKSISKMFNGVMFPGKSIGSNSFVEKSIILNDPNGLLKDNELTVFCEIDIFFGNLNIPGESSQLKFQQPVRETLQMFFQKDVPYDVILRVGGKELQSHKIILCYYSPVFSAMFHHQMSETRTNIVDITDLSYEMLEGMLEFMYTGKCETLDLLARDLIVVANKYEIDELKVICEQVLYKNLRKDNALEILVLANKHEADQLKTHVLDFIQACGPNVMKTPEWMSLEKETTLELLQRFIENK